MELVERLPSGSNEERWLVSIDGEPRVAWFVFERGDDELRDYVARCEQAADRWIGVAHPRLGRIHGKTVIDDKLAFIVDDDRGPSLADAAAQLADTPIDRERWTVAQLVTVCDALATMASHQAGFCHGDLSDHRLFVDATGRARLRAPIGIVPLKPRPANSTGAGVLVGSPSFMAPEQALGKPTSPATDVFSLASNLAYALTGVMPFTDVDEESFTRVLMRIISEPPTGVTTHAPGLDRVLARAFEKEPEHRYRDPQALGAALYECIPDAGDYDAVVSDRLAAWWPTAPQAHGTSPHLANMNCCKQWDELAPTAATNVRHCDTCALSVVRVHSLAEAVPLTGRCFSLQIRH